MSPGTGQGAAKARQRSMLFCLICGGDTRRFNSIYQRKGAGRTANGGGDDGRAPDLQADLDGTNHGKRRDEQPEYGDPHSPTKLSDACEAGVRRL
jgi:hypothetical protein